MRFCTTHRACESDDEGLCLVGWTAREAARQLDASKPTKIYVWLCTLVDTLIVAKEDEEWPEWAEQAIVGLGRGFSLGQRALDALERAEP